VADTLNFQPEPISADKKNSVFREIYNIAEVNAHNQNLLRFKDECTDSY